MDDEERGQCEGCLGYFDDSELSQPVLCSECWEKAAGYDCADLDRKALSQAITDALAELDRLNHMPVQIALYVSRAKGGLKTALENSFMVQSGRKI
jgi:hypothetical protein